MKERRKADETKWKHISPEKKRGEEIGRSRRNRRRRRVGWSSRRSIRRKRRKGRGG